MKGMCRGILIFACMFQKRIMGYIRRKKLFGSNDKLVVALSGGADSVALLRVLLQNGYTCVAAHCNFHLRGMEADRDETFVRDLCRKLCVPLHVKGFDTQTYAKRQGISIEMAARELRYAWFEDVRRQEGAEAICVAHHRDDNVETFLLNLVRGTGIQGLKGIRPKNGRIARPLLEVSRKEILDYLGTLGQEYVSDSTNMEDKFVRNKLRLDVLPLLCEINPSVYDTIAATAQRLSDVEKVYSKAMHAACQRVKVEEGIISIPLLQMETAPRAVLFELLHPLGFNASQLDDIWRSLDAEPGRMFHSPGYTVLRNRDSLLVQKRDTGSTGNLLVLKQEVQEVAPGFCVPRNAEVAYLDASKVKGPLVLRKWRPGDKFVPFGMRGFKKVRDYLRDRKFSLFDKERQYVVCSGEDIVWLVNERTDNRFRVTENTQHVLVLRVVPPAD